MVWDPEAAAWGLVGAVATEPMIAYHCASLVLAQARTLAGDWSTCGSVSCKERKEPVKIRYYIDPETE